MSLQMACRYGKAGRECSRAEIMASCARCWLRATFLRGHGWGIGEAGGWGGWAGAVSSQQPPVAWVPRATGWHASRPGLPESRIRADADGSFDSLAWWREARWVVLRCVALRWHGLVMADAGARPALFPIWTSC